ncbi:hypothetical protein BDR07DRAFT_1479946 [Suillus spraguei]|nr:hypothetical protein BDR07DRAFT_1479946 [Suillus spraguei]
MAGLVPIPDPGAPCLELHGDEGISEMASLGTSLRRLQVCLLGTGGDALTEFEDAGTPQLWLTITHPPLPLVTPVSHITPTATAESLLKDDIMQPQPHTISVLIVPDILPPSINEFLAERVAISEDAVDVLWDIVKDLVWMLPTTGEAATEEDKIFRLYGVKIQPSLGCR